jgi:uncharacterized protein YbjT (DUF2867 family)
MILVTGATGHVGADLVAQLAALGSQRVRAMTRRPDPPTAARGVEWIRADADDEASLDVAFRGVDRAFLMSAQSMGAAERPTHVPRLVDAAVRAGVEHVVLLSVFSGTAGDDPIASWCRQIEDAVTGSKLGWTILRPGRFMSNALQWARMIRRGDEVSLPFARRRAASIDPADIAAVAELALTAEPHRDAIYQLTGPEALTPIDELAVLAKLLERPLRAVEPSLAEIRAGMERIGLPATVIEAIFARTLTSEGEEPLPTFTRLLGRPPTTFERWARAHISSFQVEESH